MGSLWGSMGSLWGSMGFYGVLWGSMGFYGVKRRTAVPIFFCIPIPILLVAISRPGQLGI